MESNGRYLSPRILQGIGVALLIASGVYWGATGHESALFVSAAMGLIGLGSYAGINISVKQEIKDHEEDIKKQKERPRVPDLETESDAPTFPGQDE